MDKKNSVLKKRNQTLKLLDEVFPEISEHHFDEAEEFFIEKSITEDTVQYINFQVEKEFYAVEIAHVLEIVKTPRISFLPSASAYILGLINLRGNIIPVVNIHKLFGLDTVRELEKSCIIIMSIEKTNIGFLVDSVSQVIELRKEDIDLPIVTLDIEKTAYIVGEANIDGQLVAILDILKLVKHEIYVTS